MLDNPSWVAYDWVSCCRPPDTKIFEPGVNVTINGHTYKKFVDPFPKWSVDPPVLMDTIYLREEIDTRKVYKLVNGTDELLYDFSVQTGDEITVKGVLFSVEADEVPVIGGTRKRITLTSVPDFNGTHVKQIWIEGVGTDAHPFYPDFFMYAPAYSSGGGYRVYTSCSFQGSTQVFGDAEYCGAFTPGLAVAESQKLPEVTFSPNPFSDRFSVDCGTALEDACLKVYNSNGQLIRELHHLKGRSIEVERKDLPSGLYLVELIEKGRRIQSTRMVAN